MQLSTYLKVYTSEQSPGEVVLFSTRNAALVQIPKKLLGNISLLPERDRNILMRHGMLVRDHESEKKRILKFVDDLNRLNRTFNLKVVMNLDCNLACRYCFEGNRKGKFYMTENTADRLLDYVNSRLAGDIEGVSVTFYGGEPLLSKQLIIRMARNLKMLSKRKDVSFSFALQTNGTLLTKRVVQELKPFGLTKVFVTLDGPRDIHDALRPYKSGAGSSDTIINNIASVADIVEVHVSGNFTRVNYNAFPRVFSNFSAAGLAPARIPFVQFYPVMSEEKEFVPDFRDGCVSINEPWLYDAVLFLREETLKHGYKNERIVPGVCMMELKNSILVNYDGGIYKCPGMIGRENYGIGDIRNGIKDYGKSYHLDNWKNDECLACAYLPLCFGGCRYMKYVRDGNMAGVDCKKPYFDATLETMLRQDIRYGLK